MNNTDKQRERSRRLYAWDKKRREKNRYIAGVDEVGRGPMAGPVVAAAVILPAQPEILGIDDSKKLSPQKREALFDLILETCLAFGIGIRSNKFIDEKGIVIATHSAMRTAVAMLSLKGYTPGLVIVDGYPVEHLGVPQEAVVKADSQSASVAAASIVAKVTRDRIMRDYDSIYPEYGFASHKGYYTRSHRQALLSLGPSPIHRRSFQPVSRELDGTFGDVNRHLFDGENGG
ncbi:MAG: ribonuclease HII [Bacillota bacterium]|jgi:ribonuclease HII